MRKYRTIVGRVWQLKKEFSFIGGQTVYSLFFDLTVDLTVDRRARSPKVFRVCGEVWGAEQDILASRIKEGSRIILTGCAKGPDPAAMAQIPRLDLDRLVDVI